MDINYIGIVVGYYFITFDRGLEFNYGRNIESPGKNVEH